MNIHSAGYDNSDAGNGENRSNDMFLKYSVIFYATIIIAAANKKFSAIVG